MEDSEVRTALEMLYEAVGSQIAEVQRRGAEALSSGKYQAAQEAIARSKALEEILRDLKLVGRRLLDTVALAEPTEPAAVREVPPATAARPKPPRPPAKTPQKAYRVPILRALVERGGAGKTSAILDRVYEMMASQMGPQDLASSKSTNEPRWRNLARWERQYMKRAGLLADDSPVGIWEITAAGRRYLDEQGEEA